MCQYNIHIANIVAHLKFELASRNGQRYVESYRDRCLSRKRGKKLDGQAVSMHYEVSIATLQPDFPLAVGFAPAVPDRIHMFSSTRREHEERTSVPRLALCDQCFLFFELVRKQTKEGAARDTSACRVQKHRGEEASVRDHGD